MDNRVEVIVGAQDQTNLPLDKLNARLDELGRKVAEARVEVTDKEAAAKLAMMRVNLDSLSKRVASPRLSLQGAARVEAQLLALDVSFDRLNEKASDLTVQGGALFRLGPLFAKITSSGGGLVGMLPVLIPLIAGLAVAFTPLIASLSLVAVGFAGFAAVAVPSIAKVAEARTKLTAAERAYNDATTKSQRQAALKQEKQATEGLTAAQKQLLGPMGQIAAMFHRLSRAVQPQITRAFAATLRILKDLFPALQPLVVAAGNAVDGFLSRIDEWLRSASGKRFIHWMAADGPVAIHHFMTAMWATVNVAGVLVARMYRMGQQVDAAVRFMVKGGVGQLLNLVRGFEMAAGAVAAAVSRIVGAIQAVENAGLGGLLGAIGLEHGGIAGAAAGRLAGGLTMVGEHGRELLRLPPGTNVRSNPDTERILAQGGGGGAQRVVVEFDFHGTADEDFMKMIRSAVRVRYGGSAQAGLGYGRG